MSNSAKKLFPGWYKKAGYETDAATLKARLDAIDNIIATDDYAFWQDVIKLFLGIRVSGTNVNTFVDAFQAEDAAFPLTDNQNILRHLAAATLAILFDEDDDELTLKIALSIDTVIFLKQYDLTDFGYVLLYVKHSLQVGASNVRNNDLPEAESSLKDLEDDFDSDDDTAVDFRNHEMKSLLSVVSTLITANKALKEEINVHWWLFGEYMTEIAERFSSITINRMAFISGFELFKLTRFDIPLRNSNQYLAKALTSAQGGGSTETLNLFNGVTELTADDKTLLLEGIGDKVTYLTPLLLAIKCSGDVSGEDWSIHFKAMSNQADVKKDESPARIAGQIYREMVLINLA